jgi:catabolite regulation protein CreA
MSQLVEKAKIFKVIAANVQLVVTDGENVSCAINNAKCKQLSHRKPLSNSVIDSSVAWFQTGDAAFSQSSNNDTVIPKFYST